MRIAIVALALALFAAPALAQQDRVLMAVKPVFDAVKQAEREERASPPPTSTAERLVRLGKLDRAGHDSVALVDFKNLSPTEAQRARGVIELRVEPNDRAYRAMLLDLLPDEGWFSCKTYGQEACAAAFYILGHAPPAMQRQLLPAIEKMAASGDVDPAQVAALKARMARNP